MRNLSMTLRRRTLPAFLVCILAVLFWVPGSSAEQTAPTEPVPDATQPPEPPAATAPDGEPLPVAGPVSPAPSSDPIWAPPVPGPDTFDWVKLTNGEWLKGEIKSMRQDDLEFESDEMDDQKLDWDDIAVLRSPKRLTYVQLDRTIFTGTAIIKDGLVVVDDNGVRHEFPRDRLMSIVRGDKDSFWGFWSGKASAGISFQRGNTDQTLFSYQGFIRRQTAITRTRLDFNGAISLLNGDQNENRHTGVIKLDIFLTPRFYITPGYFEVINDRFQNIDYKLTPAAGVGYHLIKRKKVKCDIELAVGYQYTYYHSVTAGQAPDEGNGAVIPIIRLETDPYKRVELDGLYRAQVTFPNTGNTTQHGEVILSIEITKILDVDASFFWDRLEQPVAYQDGVIPEKDDFKLTLGLGLEF